MKRKLLSLILFIATSGLLHAQSLIYDNGPVANLPGGGLNGADVSHLHDGMNLYGSNNSVANAYRTADDFTIPAGQVWLLDSLVFFGYQTNSGNTSTFTDMNFRIWDGVPDDPGSTIVWGDDVTNVMYTSDWTGVYRTGDFGNANCEPSTCVARPIMRNCCIAGTSLNPGTYWVDWQANGTLASGPWCPYINLGVGVTTTGNALQYVPANTAWQAMTDTVPANGVMEPQGLPFQIIGTILTGIESHDSNNGVVLYPNPAIEKAVMTISTPVHASDGYTFELYDVMGKSVYKMNSINTNKFDINRGSLSNGIYYYELKKAGTLVKDGKLIFQ